MCERPARSFFGLTCSPRVRAWLGDKRALKQGNGLSVTGFMCVTGFMLDRVYVGPGFCLGPGFLSLLTIYVYTCFVLFSGKVFDGVSPDYASLSDVK